MHSLRSGHRFFGDRSTGRVNFSTARPDAWS
jgi:hypothetical protein